MAQQEQLVTVTIEDEEKLVPMGSTVLEALGTCSKPNCVGATIYNRLASLKHPISGATRIRTVTKDDPGGTLIYQRSATLMLCEAARALYPEMKLAVGQSFADGYHVRLSHTPSGEPTSDIIDALERRMRQLVEEDRSFESRRIEIQQAEELFERQGSEDKIRLLRTWRSSLVPVVSCGAFWDIKHGPYVPTTGYVSEFSLLPYPPGFVLSFSNRQSACEQSIPPQPKLFNTYQETRRWNKILGVSDVGELNALCLKSEIGEIIRVAEGFHEKKIAQIADEIAGHPEVKLILVAGPSSAGKTTFSKRLAIQLRVKGIRPVSLSLDNYYVNRSDTPLDEDGNYDFEALEAIDLDRFNNDLALVLKGERVYMPRFDFQLGRRVAQDRWKPLRLEPDQILIVEGIHGLNDRLTASVSSQNKYKIYSSALTQLSIDDHNRIFTSDTRLLRRIVRDQLFRGYSAAESIAIWPRVVRGEQKNIFPFQEQANVMFNSALIYETSVLKVHAERFLMAIQPDHPSRIQGYRLRKFLDHFVPILPDEVPPNSILREFIGGSAFHY